MSILQKAGFFAAAMSASGLALAADPVPLDFTTLTGSIDVASIVAAIMAVAAVMIGVHLAWKGVQFVMRAVRGA
jgi:hypothetical protein